MATITTTTPPENLTGYTVTVPSGWSATAGYGRFDIKGSFTVGEDSLEFSPDSTTGFRIGFNNTKSKADRITFVYGSLPYTIDNTKSFTFTVSGGNDASNSSLIQWAVDNNATFTKEGEEEPDTPEEPTVTPHGEIYYKGELVATLVEGETIVLHTKDFKFLGDIVIKNVGEVEETPTLISFTIDGTSYTAEEGMTWGDWVTDTKYNTDGFRTDIFGTGDDGIYFPTGTGSVTTDGSHKVKTSDEIVADSSYYRSSSGGAA